MDGIFSEEFAKHSHMFDIHRCNDKGNDKNGVGGVGVDGEVDKFAHSQKFAVPIDDKKPLKIKIAPTYMLDTVQSITLKSFRKVVGYDTFESIKKKKRSQDKDASDYYNVTVSFIVRRKSIDACGKDKTFDALEGLHGDKGFPYDDEDRDDALIEAMNHNAKLKQKEALP